MFIETWRWRLVIFGLAIGLIWSGLYGVFHPDSMLLNICYSPTVPVLQRLNRVLSSLAYQAVTAGGGVLVWYVWYSIRRGGAFREESRPPDYRALAKSALAYAGLIGLLILGIVGVSMLFQ